jgi:hypothetical protein
MQLPEKYKENFNVSSEGASSGRALLDQGRIPCILQIVVLYPYQSRPDFGGNSGGGGNKFRCSGLAHDPHGKLGLRTGQSKQCDICM